jgi:hypothetical protein
VTTATLPPFAWALAVQEDLDITIVHGSQMQVVHTPFGTLWRNELHTGKARGTSVSILHELHRITLSEIRGVLTEKRDDVLCRGTVWQPTELNSRLRINILFQGGLVICVTDVIHILIVRGEWRHCRCRRRP